MNYNYPVFTIDNECKDCYKCLRQCPVKAIKINNGKASVLSERCIACGHCVNVCPANAKKIRNDIARVKNLINTKTKVIASIAPSWKTQFQNIKDFQLIQALKTLGFNLVSETALGAQQISAATAKMVRDNCNNNLFFSSACPVFVDFINKYKPELKNNITKIMSPMMAHGKYLKDKYGQDTAVVFIGPCIGKKNESDKRNDLINVALTFDELIKWLDLENINIYDLKNNKDDKFVPEKAEEGVLYPVEGGMIDTIRTDNKNTVYITLSGLDNIKKIIKNFNPDKLKNNVFVEALACTNGCINGPAITSYEETLSSLIEIKAKKQCITTKSDTREICIATNHDFDDLPIIDKKYDETIIKDMLLKIGKETINDELNCGGCGYQTCRKFAVALIENKAEESMCLSNMRKIAQKKANAFFSYIPSGVIIVDKHLKIVECNEVFASMFDESTLIAYNAKPGLAGVSIEKVIPFKELFEVVLSTGRDIKRKNNIYNNKIFNITVFSIEKHSTLGAIIEDVTKSEFKREKISNNAKSVIQKNIETVQKIANCLGEHMAETEVLLREVAFTYDKKEE